MAIASALALGATSTYAWDAIQGAGTTDNARRVAYRGRETERLQAIEALFSETRKNIETLQGIVANGTEQDATQARHALHHLRAKLKH